MKTDTLEGGDQKSIDKAITSFSAGMNDRDSPGTEEIVYRDESQEELCVAFEEYRQSTFVK